MVQCFNLDFVIDVLKKTNNPNRDEYLKAFNSEGLSTGFLEFHDIWEDFAKVLLSRDFKIYKISEFYRHIPENHLMRKRLSNRQGMILCDILKRKFEFELKPHGYENPVPIEEPRIPLEEFNFIVPPIEKNGIKYFRIPFKEWIFSVPKDEVDKIFKEWIEHRNAYKLRKLHRKKHAIIQEPLFVTFHSLLSVLLTPTEREEFRNESKKPPESAELKIQRDKFYYELYKSIFTKNNITLSEDELQHLKELITIQIPTFDFLGITKPSSSFSRPFYFIEVKSSKYDDITLTHCQKEFIENVNEKFGILVFHIETEPNGVKVKFFSP
jgi:hypothetical protein